MKQMTPEERRARIETRKAYQRKYYQEHKAHAKDYQKQYTRTHKKKARVNPRVSRKYDVIPRKDPTGINPTDLSRLSGKRFSDAVSRILNGQILLTGGR